MAMVMATLPKTSAATLLLLSSSIRTTTTRPTGIISTAAVGPIALSIKSKLLGPFFLSRTPTSSRFCSSAQSQITETAESNPSPSDSSASSGSDPNSVAADPIREAADVLDIRVGRVLKAWRHPEADSLYVEEVDVGEAEPRTICSGLVNYIPVDQIEESNVVVLANLKPRNMRGIKSNGMLMAASDASHETVELLRPPEGSIAGERIWFGAEEEKDQQPDAASPNQIMRFFTNPHKPMILALSRPDPKKNVTTPLKAFGECRALRELANLTLILGNKDDIEEMHGSSTAVLSAILKLIDRFKRRRYGNLFSLT